jgi:hypothetical protein
MSDLEDRPAWETIDPDELRRLATSRRSPSLLAQLRKTMLA